MSSLLAEKSISQTRAEEIHRFLRDSIIKNRLKSGERIYEKSIASQFNSSTTPVREAVRRLAEEGFIEIIPHRFAIVRESSFEQFLEVNETMTVLDSYACKSAMKNLTDHDLRELTEMTSQMERYQTRDTLEEYLEINAQIHIYIWNAAKNDYFSSLITRVFDDMLQRHRQILYSQWTLHSSFLKKSIKIHRSFLEALRDRNTARLNLIIKKHWRIFAR
jgi:DNA-binding GntR family transcriptional regulator